MERSVPNLAVLQKAVVAVLDHAVKPILIISLCTIGLVFEFLLELPFIAIVGFHRLRGARSR
jgi:hypothetical protein